MTAGAWLRRLLGWVLVGATIGVLVVTIAQHRDEIAALRWRVEPLRLTASLVLLSATLAWGVWIWQRVLRRLGLRMALRPLLRVWFLSSLARYVPGKVWQFVGAAQLGRAHDMSAVLTVTSMVVSMGFTMAAAFLIGAPLLLSHVLGPTATWIASVMVAAFVMLAVHPVAINAALRLVPRALHKDVLLWNGSWRYGVQLLVYSLVSWVAYGCAFSLFVAAIFDVGLQAVPAFIAANALAVLAGVLVVIVPAGLGVREYAMNALIQPWLPGAGAAALIAVLSRLWVVTGELIGAAASVLLAGRARD